MTTSILLAQAETQTQNAENAGILELISSFFRRMDVLARPNELLDGLAQVPLIMAGVLVIVGLLCVLNGYRWHRWVVAILAFMGGLVLGSMLSGQMGKSAVIAVALGALCAIIATPLLKVAVAIFGGMTGAFIGANLWTAFYAEQADFHWAGAAMGFILMAMASFLLFRLVIVVFTSIGGAAMLIFGGITLLLHVEGWEPAIRETLSNHNLVIPMLLTVAAVGGFVLQSSWHPETLAKVNRNGPDNQ